MEVVVKGVHDAKIHVDDADDDAHLHLHAGKAVAKNGKGSGCAKSWKQMAP